jgi:hypothetical protein
MQFTAKDRGTVSVVYLLMERTPFLPIDCNHWQDLGDEL